MAKLSEYFHRREFQCQCGCGFDTVDTELLKLCNIVRELNGEPVIVSSGCRCKEHNEAVGGSEHSQHLLGKAADLMVNDPKAIADKLDYMFPAVYGIGIYLKGTKRIHVDCRNVRARWENR